MNNQTKVCPYCGNAVDVMAVMCPRCKTNLINQQPYSKKKKTPVALIVTLSIIGSLIGFFALFAIIGFVNYSVVKKSINTELDENSVYANNNPEEITFKNGEIYNSNSCIISVDSSNDTSINFVIENNSNKDYSFDVHSLAINGVMADCNIYTMNTNVPSMKKSYATLEFEDEWINSLDSIGYVDILFWVYDDTEMIKDFDTDIIRITTNEYTSDATFNTDNKTITTNGLDISLIGVKDKAITVSVVNNNRHYINYDLTNFSVNEWAYDTGIDVFDKSLFPGCISYFSIELNNKFISNNKISNIDKFEFALKTRELGDYLKEITTDKIEFP